MPELDHSHPRDDDGLALAQAAMLSRAEAEQLVELLRVLSDQVRVRLLFALVSVEELCVGDLTIALSDVSEDQVSYALKLLRTSGLMQNRRAGRVIYYRLADGFPHQLLEHCLRQLMTITANPAQGAPR